MGNLQVLKLVIRLSLQQRPIIVYTMLSILCEPFSGIGSVKLPGNYTSVTVTHKAALP